MTGWHFHRGSFVGVHWSLWADASETETREAALSFRSLLCERWPAADEAVSEEGGFTALWEPAEAQIELYYHAPRELGSRTVPGSVQLHVDHRQRAAEQEADAAARQKIRTR